MIVKAGLSKWVADQVRRDRKDFRREVFRCGGKGGQKQNKTETGVRITDLVTGLSCEGREHREQRQNQDAAFRRLVALMVAHYQEIERSGREDRFRSEASVVRTYHEKRNEVKCHVTGFRADYGKVLDGDLDGLILARLGVGHDGPERTE